MLTVLAKELQTSLRRMLASRRRAGGRFPTGIEQACALDLTAFDKGSAVLTLEYAGRRDRRTFHGDAAVRVADEMIEAMQEAESGAAGWDESLQVGVIEGWDTLSKPLGEGIDSICITLVADGPKRSARLTRAFRQNLSSSGAARAVVARGEVEGVLWECDRKQRTAQLDEADGNRVALVLTEDMDERVTELRRQRVRVSGRIERTGGRVTRMHVAGIALVQDDHSDPDPRFGGFWDNSSVDELTRRQGVTPVTDLNALAGDWPVEDSVDDLLAMLREVRGG